MRETEQGRTDQYLIYYIESAAPVISKVNMLDFMRLTCMDLDKEKMQKIRNLLKSHPKGLSISEISSRLNMNRNSVAKYLELLSISGKVEMQEFGSSKVYYL